MTLSIWSDFSIHVPNLTYLILYPLQSHWILTCTLSAGFSIGNQSCINWWRMLLKAFCCQTQQLVECRVKLSFSTHSLLCCVHRLGEWAHDRRETSWVSSIYHPSMRSWSEAHLVSRALICTTDVAQTHHPLYKEPPTINRLEAWLVNRFCFPRMKWGETMIDVVLIKKCLCEWKHWYNE